MKLPGRVDAICVSCEMGFLKPSRQAFGVALDKLSVPPQQVLFFDDGEVNVEAARDLGLVAHLVRSPAEAEVVLREYAVL